MFIWEVLYSTHVFFNRCTSMKKSLPVLLIVVLVFSAFSAVCTPQKEKPVVVCTTTVLASIVDDLAGDLVTIEVIASPAVCPAHYDVKPSDIEAFRKADLILMHGFEPWVSELKQASGSTAPIVKIPGPWNTPSFLKARYSAVADALKKYLGLDVSVRLAKCLKAIDDVDAYLKKLAEEKGFKGAPVVCMLWQKAFVSYLGFKVVAVYGPPEKVSAKQYEEILKNASTAKVLLIVDNLQSGEELGEKIALEVGCVQVALSNFPGIAPELKNMTEVMKWNAEQLAKALETAELKGEINRLRGELETWKTAALVASALAVVFLMASIFLALKLRKK